MVCASVPSAGHCNSMGTALSMNSLAEAMGMSLPGLRRDSRSLRRACAAWLIETGRRVVEWSAKTSRPAES